MDNHNEFGPRIPQSNSSDLRRGGAAILQVNTVAEPIQCQFGELPHYSRHVLFLHAAGRMQKTIGHGSIISQQQDSSRILIKSAHGINTCLLYTSDAADDLLCVDLGGRRIIKKKKKDEH